MPEISVVVPCYNHAHYLPQAIASVLGQTFCDWEAIIVDDGSSDDTRRVATHFPDPRVRYVYQDNQGLSAARNTGISEANGDYLAFLDADDEWEPGFLGNSISVLEEKPELGFVYSRNSFIDRDGKVLPRLGGQVLRGNHFRERLLEGGFFPVHAALLRSHILVDIGVFDVGLTSLEDWDLWLRISNKYQVLALDEVLARYRIYPDSMSTNAQRMHENRIAVLTKYFGGPVGPAETWSSERRHAYGFAYRSAALIHIMQDRPQEGWQYLAQAVAIYPGLLQRLDTFYELALGDQPRGYRGQADLLDIETNGGEMLNRMNILFADASPEVQSLRASAYGNAYLSLAMLSDQAGNWSEARHYMALAARSNPGLLAPQFMRRLMKLYAGKRVADFLKALNKTGR